MIILLDEERKWHHWEKWLSSVISLDSSKMIAEEVKVCPPILVFLTFFDSSQDPKFHHFMVITAKHPAFPSPPSSFWCVSIRDKFSIFLTSFNIDSCSTKARGHLWRDSIYADSWIQLSLHLKIQGSGISKTIWSPQNLKYLNNNLKGFFTPKNFEVITIKSWETALEIHNYCFLIHK